MLCESQVHSAPEPTHQQVCGAESLSGVRSYSALQHKPFPFYFPKAGPTLDSTCLGETKHLQMPGNINPD